MTFSPQFKITNSITAALTKIERARGFLEAAKLSKDWISEMQARALILEAHYTTHIEGTHLTLEQSEKILSGKKVTGADPDEVKELLNYKKAFELVADYLGSDDPITESLIREIHKRLVQGVRKNSAKPGEYRKIQNYVVNSQTGKPVYTPPAAHDVSPMMSEFTDWLNKEKKISPVLKAAIAQFQLVHIHPFIDGNGRTARLLSTLCLYQYGYDFKQLFTISEYYDRDRPSYYRAIQEVRENNLNMTGWLEYFTEGLATQMAEVKEKGETIIRKDLLLSKAHKAGLKERSIALLKFIIKNEQATIAECEKKLKQNRRSLQRDLKVLIEEGFVKERGTSPTDPTKFYKPVL